MSEIHVEKENDSLKTIKTNRKIPKCPILSITLLKKFEFDKLLEYIKNLHHVLLKKDKKLKKYKEKIKILNSKTTIKDENVENTENNLVQQQNELPNESKEKDKSPNFLDEIREAAELAQNENGFIYEPTSGLYYDQNTGYYYNAEYGLYYDGNTGCYYKLNTDTNALEFHSQAESQINEKEKANDDDDNDDRDEVKPKKTRYHYKSTYYSDDDDDDYKYNRRRYRDDKKKYPKLDRKYENRKIIKYDDDYLENDIEDGELLTGSDENDDNDDYVCKKNNHCGIDKYEDIAKKYPPSLRIIVQETSLNKIKVGTLYIITFKGGTLGREGEHDVVIPDINISKFHLKFSYNENKSIYQCIDLGSRNGTILNGKRMSTAKQESDLMDIVHGSIIQLSQTKLLCHIHSGNSTCGLCEPGLLIDLKNDDKLIPLTHKEQLKKLQKRYGLENEKYIETKQDSKYNDRAAVRRVTVGSSSHHEKTQMASTETAISSDNKGFKLLSKLGWKKGETLGKGNEGLLQPISVTGNIGTKGLGNNEAIPSLGSVSKIDLKKAEKWKRTQERYNKLPKSDIFNDDDSEKNK